MPTVLTLGSFDLLHPGHVMLLSACKKIAGPEGAVVVGLNRDDFILDFKGRMPVQSYEERADMLASLRFVDSILATPGPNAQPLIDSVDPDFLVIGSDWANRDYYSQLQITAQYLQERQIVLLYLDRNSGHSSTELKERVRAS